jgi:hypothetical protein
MDVVELTCAECGTTFTRPRSQYVKENREYVFCSSACRYRSPLAKRGDGAKIPWLQPKTWQEQALAEMITGAAIEYRRTLPDAYDESRKGLGGEEYWSGYWAALIDYGRRIFNAKEPNR